jgi:hypothetical protein
MTTTTPLEEAEPTLRDVLVRLDLTLEAVKATNTSVASMTVYGRRNRTLSRFNIILTVVVAGALALGGWALLSSTQNHDSIYQSCLAGNVVRMEESHLFGGLAGELTLWTPAQKAEFLANVNSTLAQRDCEAVANK